MFGASVLNSWFAVQTMSNELQEVSAQEAALTELFARAGISGGIGPATKQSDQKATNAVSVCSLASLVASDATKHEAQAVDAVLGAIREHWSKLKAQDVGIDHVLTSTNRSPLFQGARSNRFAETK